MSLAAWAQATSRIRLGLLVGAVTFRNPGLVAKLATTLDHISNGRAILGLGGAWFEYEHTAHGIDFGRSVGRLQQIYRYPTPNHRCPEHLALAGNSECRGNPECRQDGRSLWRRAGTQQQR